MSAHGQLNFSISKPTTTTSTTNANTSSLPAALGSPQDSINKKKNKSPRDLPLSLFKLATSSAESSSNVGSVDKTTASGDLTPANTSRMEPSEMNDKQDLIGLFEKFDLQASKDSDDADSIDEKFEQFKGEEDDGTRNASVDIHCSEGLPDNKHLGGAKHSEIVNAAPEDISSRDPVPESRDYSNQRNYTNSSVEIEPLNQDRDQKTIFRSESNEVDTNGLGNGEFKNFTADPTRDEVESKDASMEIRPSANSNDFLTVDNSEPLEEFQLPEAVSGEQSEASPPKRPVSHRKSSLVNASKRVVHASEQYQQSHKPFDFQIFLAHLKKKSADPIVRYIRSFLVSFARQASSMSITQMFRATANFKAFIEENFKKYEPFASMSDSDIENSLEGVEKLVMNRLYDYCFAPEACKKFNLQSSSAMAEDLYEDAAFVLQVEKFSWISGIHLDVDLDQLLQKKMAVSNDNIDYMEYAAKELNKINSYRAPRDKIICILNACKILFSLLKVNSQETNADSFIPLLIIVILKAKIDNIISNLHYIERFRGEKWLNHGETSYYLSTMQGAISFIQNIKCEDLTISEDQYNAHMEAWDAEVRQKGVTPFRPQSQNNDVQTVPSSTRSSFFPSDVLMAGADMVSKSISNFISPSNSSPEPQSNRSAEISEEVNSVKVDEVFIQLQEVFPNLDKAILRDVIVMKKADVEASLEVCLTLVNVE